MSIYIVSLPYFAKAVNEPQPKFDVKCREKYFLYANKTNSFRISLIITPFLFYHASPLNYYHIILIMWFKNVNA